MQWLINFFLAFKLFFSGAICDHYAEKVSIIIPVYDAGMYIEECLDSVIDQTYKNLEIICVDDCGTDNSMKIVEEYAKKDKRIKVIHHEKNKGLAVTRNTGIRHAKGEYIFFLDSDDYLSLNLIEESMNKQKETNSDIVISQIEIFASDASQQERCDKFKDLVKTDKIPSVYQVEFKNFYNSIAIIPFMSWGKLYKKDFLLKNNIWFINKNVPYEDIGFFLKFLSNLPLIATLESVGIHYRIREKSITDLIRDDDMYINSKISMEDALDYINKQFEKSKAEKLTEFITTVEKYQKILNYKS